MKKYIDLIFKDFDKETVLNFDRFQLSLAMLIFACYISPSEDEVIEIYQPNFLNYYKKEFSDDISKFIDTEGALKNKRVLDPIEKSYKSMFAFYCNLKNIFDKITQKVKKESSQEYYVGFFDSQKNVIFNHEKNSSGRSDLSSSKRTCNILKRYVQEEVKNYKFSAFFSAISFLISYIHWSQNRQIVSLRLLFASLIILLLLTARLVLLIYRTKKNEFGSNIYEIKTLMQFIRSIEY